MIIYKGMFCKNRLNDSFINLYSFVMFNLFIVVGLNDSFFAGIFLYICCDIS